MSYCSLEEAWGENPYTKIEPTPPRYFSPPMKELNMEKNFVGKKPEPYNEEDNLSVIYEETKETENSEDDEALMKMYQHHLKVLKELEKRIMKKKKLKDQYQTVLQENFENKSENKGILYDAKDIIIIILCGIFLIFIMDLFVKFGCKLKE